MTHLPPILSVLPGLLAALAGLGLLAARVAGGRPCRVAVRKDRR